MYREIPCDKSMQIFGYISCSKDMKKVLDNASDTEVENDKKLVLYYIKWLSGYSSAANCYVMD